MGWQAVHAEPFASDKNKKEKKIKRNEKKNVNMIEIFKSFTAEMFKPHFGWQVKTTSM